ncbi:MAG: replication protein RepA [Candidatus Methanofastidiosia archaeon]
MSRKPAIEREIVEIEDKDDYVTVIGTVIMSNPNDYTMVIDDGTGQITIFGDKLYEIGTAIRVIGKPFEMGKGINAEVIQDFSSVDIDIYHKIKKWEELI